jgi:feruloyl esterase
MIRLSLAVVLAMIAPATLAAQTLSPRSCESLASLVLPNTSITLASATPGGSFTPPAADGTPAAALPELPAFCRVAATLHPSTDSDIKVEIWLPMSTWNGKFLAAGNGGWAGSVSYPALAAAVRRGYATASTDTGHVGNTAVEMLDHPEKLVDYAYRAVHEMTVTGKSVTTSFFGAAPRLSYWNSCSTGGRQGLREAQMYPQDFDGIIAGAPALDPIRHAAGRMQVSHAVLKSEASYIPPSKYPMVHQAVVAACDMLDGLRDGLIDDPRACHFDPAVLACQEGDGPSCLTRAQVQAASKILSPVMVPDTNEVYLPRMQPGSELAWGIQAGPRPYGNTMEVLKYLVFKNPQWDWRTFNFTSHLKLLDETGDIVKATDPNLQPFASRRGKLLIYHGWSDSTIVPENTINYYGRVLETMGGAQQSSDWLRLFMVPGMQHCGGGDGPNSFDAITALEQWVEQGKAPDTMIASHSTNGRVDRTRPLCPYPQVARYTGSGSIDDAANFVCRAP